MAGLQVPCPRREYAGSRSTGGRANIRMHPWLPAAVCFVADTPTYGGTSRETSIEAIAKFLGLVRSNSSCGATLVADSRWTESNTRKARGIRHGKRLAARGKGVWAAAGLEWGTAARIFSVAIDGHAAGRKEPKRGEERRDGDDKGVVRHHRRGRGMESVRSKGVGWDCDASKQTVGVHRLGICHVQLAPDPRFFASAKSECARV